MCMQTSSAADKVIARSLPPMHAWQTSSAADKVTAALVVVWFTLQLYVSSHNLQSGEAASRLCETMYN